MSSNKTLAFYSKAVFTLATAAMAVWFGLPIDAQSAKVATDSPSLALQQPAATIRGGAGSPTAPPTVTASKIRMAVLRVTYNDTTGYTPPSDGTFQGIVSDNYASINNYLAEQSGNVTGASLNYIRTVPLDYPTPTVCDSYSYVTALMTTWNDAKAQSEADPNNRFDFNAIDQVLIALPKFCDPWRGGADNGGPPKKRQWLYPEYINASNIIHEMGHNYGLGHANFLKCNATPNEVDKSISGSITIDDTCTTTNYGDGPSIMGTSYDGLSSLNAVHWEQINTLNNFGWSNITFQSLDKNTNTGTTGIGTTPYAIDIAPFTAVCTQTKVLKIKRQNVRGVNMGDQLYVEYRQANPGKVADLFFNESLPAAKTIQIRLKSLRISENPNEPQNAGDSQLIGTLQAGQTITDEVGKVRITLNGFSAKGANISVQYYE